MWASIQVLIVLTVILATIFFFAEYTVQPEEYNYGRSLLWAFTRYIGDPGKFSGPGPITFTGRKENWTIFLISRERQSEFALHFITRAYKKTERESTILETSEFDKFYREISESLEKSFDLKSELDNEYRPAGVNNSAVRIGGCKTTNAFTIRVSSELTV